MVDPSYTIENVDFPVDIGSIIRLYCGTESNRDTISISCATSNKWVGIPDDECEKGNKLEMSYETSNNVQS